MKELYLAERALCSTSPILVVAHYCAQVDAINHQLQQYDDPNLKVCTVDKAQGSEAVAVILSCVRSTRVSQFGEDKNRMTVALSRAKNRLHIVGCHAALMDSARWRWVLNVVSAN